MQVVSAKSAVAEAKAAAPGAAADTVMSEAGASEAAQPASSSQPAPAGSAAEASAGAAATPSGEADASDPQALLEAYLKRLLTLYYHFANAALLFQSPQVCVLVHAERAHDMLGCPACKALLHACNCIQDQLMTRAG